MYYPITSIHVVLCRGARCRAFRLARVSQVHQLVSWRALGGRERPAWATCNWWH